MIRKIISKLYLSSLLFTVFVYLFWAFWYLSFSFVSAKDLDFAIVPEAEMSDDAVINDVKSLANSPWSVWDKYKEISSNDKRSLGDKLSSGIMTRDTLLDYVVYLIKFMSQLWLVVGAVMFIYAGYMYATDIMWWDASKWKKAIKYAIVWVVVLSFSYAIMKILTNMFIK